MTRTVYIDISAKIEEWGADSVIALADGGEIVMIIPSAIKRQARDWLKVSDRTLRKEAIYIYRLLAIFVYLIVEQELDAIELIVIDNDYPGSDPASKIKNELVPLLKRKRQDFSGKNITFAQAKGTKADRLARQVFKAKTRRYRHITLWDIQNAG